MSIYLCCASLFKVESLSLCSAHLFKVDFKTIVYLDILSKLKPFCIYMHNLRIL